MSVAAALKEQAEPGEILVSSTVRDLVAGPGSPSAGWLAAIGNEAAHSVFDLHGLRTPFIMTLVGWVRWASARQGRRERR